MSRQSWFDVRLFILILVLFSESLAASPVPSVISYQGYLTDPAGSALSGSYPVQFSIYNMSTGGVPLWSETQNVTVSSGLFSVQLGQSIPFPLGLFDNPAWLGVNVAADGEMSPRLPFDTVAFAFRADDALTLNGVSAASLDQSAHVADFANPHRVNAAQIGAADAIHFHNGGDITSPVAQALDADTLDGFDSLNFIMTGQADSIDSNMIQDGAIGAADLNILYAGSLAKGGPALDLECSACVSLGELDFPPALAGHNHDASYVNLSGDTMTGPLVLPAGGLSVGGSELVVSNGWVGIGTNLPESQLDVGGDIRLTTDGGNWLLGGVADLVFGPYFVIRDIDAGLAAPDRLRIYQGTGDVGIASKLGIGTFAPDALLDITGGGIGTRGLEISVTDPGPMAVFKAASNITYLGRGTALAATAWEGGVQTALNFQYIGVTGTGHNNTSEASVGVAGVASGNGANRGVYGLADSGTENIAVYGESTAPLDDSPAVYGEHAVTDYYGTGVKGVGLYKGVEGVVSASGSGSYFGVTGTASTSSGQGAVFGVTGDASGGNVNYGIFGSASGTGLNYAGYFNGNVTITGYTQLATVTGAPPATDCDEAIERGQMKVDSGAGLLYICVDSGWVAK